MFPSLKLGELIAVLVMVVGVATGTAWVTHRVDLSTMQKMELQYAAAQSKAITIAKERQAAADKVTLESAVEEAKSQQKIVTRTVTITKEVKRYVKDHSHCVTYGLVRVLDAALLGVDPSQLLYAPGQSDDACAPITSSALAQNIVRNYGAALQNGDELTKLQNWVRKMEHQQ